MLREFAMRHSLLWGLLAVACHRNTIPGGAAAKVWAISAMLQTSLISRCRCALYFCALLVCISCVLNIRTLLSYLINMCIDSASLRGGMGQAQVFHSECVTPSGHGTIHLMTLIQRHHFTTSIISHQSSHKRAAGRADKSQTNNYREGSVRNTTQGNTQRWR